MSGQAPFRTRLFSPVAALAARAAGRLPVSGELAASSGYALLGNCALRLAQVGGAIFLARAMSPAEYGQLALVQSTMAVFVTVGAMGGGLMATRFVAERRRLGGTGLGAAIVVALLVSAAGGALAGGLMLLNAAAICRAAFRSLDLVPLVQLGCVFVVVAAVNDTLVGILRGFRAFRSISWNLMLQAAALLAAYVVLVPMWAGRGAVAALSVSGAVGVLAALRPIRRGWVANSAAVRCADVIADLRLVWHFSLPSMLSGMVCTPALWIMNTALAHSPGGFGAVALFNVSNMVRLAILFVPLLLIQVVSPFAMGADRNRFQDYMRLVHDYITVPTYAVSLALVLCAKPLLAVFGPAYSDGQETLALVLLSVAAQAFGSVSSICIQCTRLLWKGLMLNAIWAVALAATTAWLAERHGARAAALAFLVSYSLLTGGQAWLLRHVLPRRIVHRTLTGIGFTVAVAAGLLAAGHTTALGRSVVLAGIAGAVCLRLPAREARVAEASQIA